MQSLDSYLRDAFERFHHDPADSNFQEGYLAGLLNVARIFHLELYHEWLPKLSLSIDRCSSK